MVKHKDKTAIKTTLAKGRYYWQAKRNCPKNYVATPEWLIPHSRRIVLIDVYVPHMGRKTATLMAYLKNGTLFHATFASLGEAKAFAMRTVFDGSNKEIRSV